MKRTALKRKTALRKQSPKRKKDWPKYLKLRKLVLEYAGFCEWPEGCTNRSEDIHHIRGRRGSLLLDSRYFLALCRLHHDWCHSHPNKARLMGLLQ